MNKDLQIEQAARLADTPSPVRLSSRRARMFVDKAMGNHSRRDRKRVRLKRTFYATLAVAAVAAAAFFIPSGINGGAAGPDKVYEMESVHSAVEVLDTAAVSSDTLAPAELPVFE